MEAANYYEGITHTVKISTDSWTGCEHCSERVGENLSKSINHYIDEHGYKLLHVGTETSHDADGKPWHSTVAVVGK